jgi:FtsZ-interacting cell division protein ZipA
VERKPSPPLPRQTQPRYQAMTVPEARTHIATLTDPAALNALLVGETRKGVIDAVEARLKELAEAASAQDEEPATEAATEEQDSEVAQDEEPATEAPAEEQDSEVAQDEEPATEAPAQKAPPVQQGKGGKAKPTAPTALYVLLNPNAKGKLGLKGYIYERSRVVNDQDLLAQLHAAGCRQVKKLK